MGSPKCTLNRRYVCMNRHYIPSRGWRCKVLITFLAPWSVTPLSLSFAVHGTKGADLPLFIAAMVRQTSCERGGPTLGVDGEFKQSHFLPGSHREDSLGLASADSVTRPTSRTVLSLSPSSLSLFSPDARSWLHWMAVEWARKPHISIVQFFAKRRIVIRVWWYRARSILETIICLK